MKSEKPFYLLGSAAVRPESNSTLFVDGTGDGTFRKGIDKELSHWIPNCTEEQYKAPTSTESCFKYLDANPMLPYDLVVNNHLDIDGMLSVFTLAYPTVSLKYRKDICNAAKAGDFWGWSEGKGFTIFQELTRNFQHYWKENTDLGQAYQESFDLILRILNVDHDILESQRQLVKDGIIKREILGERLVSYFVPKELTKGKEESFLNVAEPNELITDRLSFWPQVRNYYDEEKLHLTAIETGQGIHYDLWVPGYTWADTSGVWRPKNILLPDDMKNPYVVNWPELVECIQRLQELELGKAKWTVFPSIYLFEKVNPRGFPIVASSLGDSQIPLGSVAEVLRELEQAHNLLNQNSNRVP